MNKQGVAWSALRMCAFGARDPSGYYYYKLTSLTRNFPEGLLDPVFKVCPLKKARASGVNRAYGNHKHQMLEGNAPGYGSRTKLAQVYPYAFCRAIIRCILPLGNWIVCLQLVYLEDIANSIVSRNELKSLVLLCQADFQCMLRTEPRNGLRICLLTAQLP